MPTQTITAARLRAELGTWRGSGHLYTHLADVIRLLVSDGRLTDGTRLPAERELAGELGLSRTSVAAAYASLRDSGHAVSRRGSGTVTRYPGRRRVHRVAAAGAEAIDLTTACPAPWSGLRDLNLRTHEAHPEAFLEEGYDLVGLPDLRAAVAERYTARGLETGPEQIMITLGAQHALFLLARTLLRRGDRAMVEAPTYPHAREALSAAGGRLVEIAVRDQEWDLDGALEVLRRIRPRVGYLIPDHHNPTGATMRAQERVRLIEAATRAGTVLVVDETTAELSFDGSCVVPFAAAGPRELCDEHVVTIGSLSKTVWGGLRVGWIRTTPDRVAALESARRLGDLGTATWEQFLALEALADYPRILAERGAALASGEHALRAALAVALPSWHVPAVRGGVCTWVRLDEPVSSALVVAAARWDLLLSAGPRFGSSGAFERYLRLPFCLPVPLLETAVERLTGAHGALVPGAAPRPADRTVI